MSTLTELVAEAAASRAQVKGGDLTEGPAELHERLLKTRAAQDRVEEILGSLMQIRGKTQQAVEDAQDLYDDSYAVVVNAPGARQTEEFSTGREREARYGLKTVDSKLALRKVQKADREVYSALEFVRLLHRGIDGARRDLDTRIRLISLETALEH